MKPVDLPATRDEHDLLGERAVPAAAYWGIHTFKFVNASGQTTLVRWRFAPQDGEQRLSAELPRIIESTVRDFLAEQEMIASATAPD